MTDRTPTPPAHPRGWYCVGFSADLKPGGRRAFTFLGNEVVLYRTRSGRLCLSDAYCPHLGAHLGDGEVRGEDIWCPFHGLTFDPQGRCSSSPYGKPPQAARLRMYEVYEADGVIVAYHGEEKPDWRPMPSPPPGPWPRAATRTWRFRGHPQEVTENSVDFAHLGVLHRFADVEILRPVETSGPTLTAAYAMRRRLPLLRKGIYTEFRIRVDGLGYSEVEISLPALGYEIRQWVLPTPVDADTVDLRLAVSLRARGWIRPAAQQAIAIGVAKEINRDIAIWRRKQYLARPALSKEDGPIGRYRAWARQFYPTTA